MVVAGGDNAKAMHFLSIGVVAVLRISNQATIDASRRIRCALASVLEKVKATDDISNLLILCLAYEDSRLSPEVWVKVDLALQALPVTPEDDPANLAALLISFPEHGSVIVNGAKGNSPSTISIRMRNKSSVNYVTSSPSLVGVKTWSSMTYCGVTPERKLGTSGRSHRSLRLSCTRRG